MDFLNGMLNDARGMLDAHPAIGTALWLAGLALVALLADLVAKRRLVRIIRRFAGRSRFAWDDALVEHKVFRRLAQILPAAIVYFGLPLVPDIVPALAQVIRNVALAYLVLLLTLTLSSALAAANSMYEQTPEGSQRPIKGLVQVAQILLFIVGGVLVIASLIDRSPLVLLGGLGAMTAVLLLVFKDTILSLVASVQLSSLDMVRVGDWIEMPAYQADGDVIDVSLPTVRVQNWDKTITTIPTYKLVSESFRNWRGMSESGGRRIKRSIKLDMSSIRFLEDEEVKEYEKFALLRDYVESKQRELAEYNAGLKDARGDDVNMRRLTNIGTFRAYVFNYLKHHPDIRRDMTLLVRQLQPGPDGLPIEVYAFTNDTAWARYEGIMSDIFDHLLAIVPQFSLRVFQQPTGADFRTLAPPERGPVAPTE